MIINAIVRSWHLRVYFKVCFWMHFVQGLKWSQRGRSKGHEYISLKKPPNKQTKKPHKHHQLAFKSSFCEALPVGLSMGAVSGSPAAHHIPRMSQQSVPIRTVCVVEHPNGTGLLPCVLVWLCWSQIFIRREERLSRYGTPAKRAAPKLNLLYFLKELSGLRAVIFEEILHLWKEEGGRSYFTLCEPSYLTEYGIFFTSVM